MYTYALSLCPSLPHHEVRILAPATRANGWTHPIPFQYHPKATRRLMRTGMPTAERPAKRTHGWESRLTHTPRPKGRGPHRRPQPVSATQPDSVCLAKSRRAASRFSRQKGGSHPLTRLPTRTILRTDPADLAHDLLDYPGLSVLNRSENGSRGRI